MRISTRIMAEHIKANLAKQSAQLIESQKKIATGKKINSLSDDPAGAEKLLAYRTTLSTIEQYQENITDAKTRVEYTETVLGQVDELLDDAQSIAANGDLESKEALAQQIAGIRDQILALANSTYSGNYIFSGELSDTPAFDAAGTYNGDNGSHEIIIGEGIQMSLNSDGESIFIEDGDNLFTVLDSLEAALIAGDEAAIDATREPLLRINDQVELVRTQFAASYTRLESTEEHWTGFSNSVENMRSGVEDADVTEAAIDLQLQQTSYETLLKVAAQVIQPTLVDFL